MITKEEQLSHKCNFEKNGRFYLVRCFNCDSDKGTENYAINIASGICTWCGWPHCNEDIEKNLRDIAIKNEVLDEISKLSEEMGLYEEYGEKSDLRRLKSE